MAHLDVTRHRLCRPLPLEPEPEGVMTLDHLDPRRVNEVYRSTSWLIHSLDLAALAACPPPPAFSTQILASGFSSDTTGAKETRLGMTSRSFFMSGAMSRVCASWTSPRGCRSCR